MGITDQDTRILLCVCFSLISYGRNPTVPSLNVQIGNLIIPYFKSINFLIYLLCLKRKKIECNSRNLSMRICHIAETRLSLVNLGTYRVCRTKVREKSRIKTYKFIKNYQSKYFFMHQRTSQTFSVAHNKWYVPMWLYACQKVAELQGGNIWVMRENIHTLVLRGLFKKSLQVFVVFLS